MAAGPTLADVAARARRFELAPLGAFHPVEGDGAPEDCGTLVLLGPDGPGFWPHFAASPEFRDGAPDPLDRWSARVVAALAAGFGGAAILPFGGPPFAPFTAWARRSGEAWISPVGLLVHASLGLLVSYRGALALPGRLELPATGPRPCDACPAPCLAACPVGALQRGPYDLGACHGFLDTAPGRDCLGRGCAVRRACPVGRELRPEAQSAFHMTAFHGTESACDG
ncbi:MAG TPA: ferredoxin [Amaricoccus sp.]|nr:ferredoxin [Amaricoccus sp.]